MPTSIQMMQNYFITYYKLSYNNFDKYFLLKFLIWNFHPCMFYLKMHYLFFSIYLCVRVWVHRTMHMEASRGCQVSSSTTICLFLWGRVSPWPSICVFSASWKASQPQLSCLYPCQSRGTGMWMPPSSYMSSQIQTPVLTIAEPSLQFLLLYLMMFHLLQWAIVFFFK